MQSKSTDKIVVLEIKEQADAFHFTHSIQDALNAADNELLIIQENIHSIDTLKPDCDKIDYAVAAGSGALCGVLDIFLVGKPGETRLGDITDKWFEDRTKDFAKLCGWNNTESGSLASAVRFLEKKFKIPYDQRGAGDAASFVFDLSPTNHHFKSLGHNPTIVGLFFSILDQFTNSSHFVTEGELISLAEADNSFELRGGNIPAKLFCGIANWFGHLISDISGSSGSKGRGMGIPSPILAWTNDIIAIRRKLKIPASDFDRSMNELAFELYKQGFDARFQAAQMIPVIVNELVVRLFYAVRRMLRYYSHTAVAERSFKAMWKSCEPFSNPSVKKMLTVAHGTFCLIDLGDAVVRGFVNGAGSFNVVEFCMRINFAGVGRFTISLYGEAKRGIHLKKVQQNVIFAKREQVIVQDYVAALHQLAETYGDKTLKQFVNDIVSSELYIQTFHATAVLAEKVNVPEEKILKNKTDIDQYFLGDKYHGEEEK